MLATGYLENGEGNPVANIRASSSVRGFAAGWCKPTTEAGWTSAGMSFRVLVHKTVDDVVDRIETMGDDIEVLRIA